MSHKRTQSYMTLHSPRGQRRISYRSLWKRRGFGLEQARIASDDVYIGIRRGNQITCLPSMKMSSPRN